MEKKIIDARGLSCPQPVVLCRNCINSGSAEFEIIVDDPVAEGNIKRIAKTCGYSTEMIPADNGDTKILVKKEMV